MKYISNATAQKVEEWLGMVLEKDNDDYKYTDGDLVDSAIDIFKAIREEVNTHQEEFVKQYNGKE